MSEAQVLLTEDPESSDGVRTLTLNAQLWMELADALRAAARPCSACPGDHRRGGAFCSGADISTPEDIHPNATLREALANEARAQPGNFATADSTEAYAAFAEKREPAFTGRWAVVPRSE